MAVPTAVTKNTIEFNSLQKLNTQKGFCLSFDMASRTKMRKFHILKSKEMVDMYIENDKDMDYMLEVDRMINEGLGGGTIEYDYQLQQLEVPDTNQPRKKNDTIEK
ncbi:hypothetical protein DTX80_03165 [Bacilli bacterium]|nr:hypothetical protein DEJ64_03535 [Bacilli bacterium]PZD90356.1 hypothetical protein DEJ60_02675 [Bacilli bacterium]PZD92142.1 hypothetical protein DEJ66_03055 [Bacilli bacterium]RCO07182.1 hypothetical protein DTX80_03165 [Bacilli bacterium]RCO09230.1 hypothetical protein DTX79_10115 [Bacilli bacterium]